MPLGPLGPPHNLTTEASNVCHSSMPLGLCSGTVAGNCSDWSVAICYHLPNVLNISLQGRYLVEGAVSGDVMGKIPPRFLPQTPHASLVISPFLMGLG